MSDAVEGGDEAGKVGADSTKVTDSSGGEWGSSGGRGGGRGGGRRGGGRGRFGGGRGGGAGGDRGPCYNCGQRGHIAGDCPNPRVEGEERKNIMQARSRFLRCFNCGKVGHMSADCIKPAGNKACYNCGQVRFTCLDDEALSSDEGVQFMVKIGIF